MLFTCESGIKENNIVIKCHTVLMQCADYINMFKGAIFLATVKYKYVRFGIWTPIDIQFEIRTRKIAPGQRAELNFENRTILPPPPTMTQGVGVGGGHRQAFYCFLYLFIRSFCITWPFSSYRYNRKEKYRYYYYLF